MYFSKCILLDFIEYSVLTMTMDFAMWSQCWGDFSDNLLHLSPVALIIMIVY